MPYPLVMTTTNTFNEWFGATNNLISELANPNYVVLAGRTTNSASTTRVNGAFSAATLTVSSVSTLTGNVSIAGNLSVETSATSTFKGDATFQKSIAVTENISLSGNLTIAASKTATLNGNLTVVGPIGVGGNVAVTGNVSASNFIGNLNADNLTSGTVNVARLQNASASQAGIVNTGAQTFAGNKTFQGTLAASGQLTVATNAAFATNLLYVDTTNSRVGVKTTTPQYDLEINGTIKATTYIGSLAPDTGAIANGTITYVKLSNDTPGRVLMINATGNVQAITMGGDAGISSAGVLTINTSSTLNITGLRVSGAANVVGAFGINGAANAIGNLGVGGTLSALGQLSVAANAAFDTNVLFVDTVTNRVGVNNSTPTTALEVTGTVTATTFAGSGASLTTLNASAISTGTIANNRISGSYTGFANLSITTSTQGPHEGLLVQRSGGGFVRIHPNLEGANYNPITLAADAGLIFSGSQSLVFAPQSSSNSGMRMRSDGATTFYANGNYIMKIGAAADVVSTGPYVHLQAGLGMTTWPTTATATNAALDDNGLLAKSVSSIRYKKDIETIDGTHAMTAVMGMRPVVYRANNINSSSNERRHIGFIAEEVREVAPLLVTYDEGGETGTPNYVTYDRVTAYLVSVVQQQQQQIQQLQSQLTTLISNTEPT